MIEYLKKKLNSNNKCFLWVAWLIFIAAFSCVLTNIENHTLEYDEIWTCRNYVKLPVRKILTDVSTPNNHVLNTLALKSVIGITGTRSAFTLRLSSLLAFTGLFILLLTAACRFLRSNHVRICWITITLFSGMILYYAGLARGYALQIFFTFGMFYSLLCYGQSRKPYCNALFWLLCAVGSCLSISSGVLYVAIITFCWWLLWTPFRSGIRLIARRQYPLWTTGLVFSIFVLIWYVGNYQAFAAGKAHFGRTLSGFTPFLNYSWGILQETGLLYAMLPCLAGSILLKGESRKQVLLCFASCLLMLLFSPVSGAGPARVYLALIPLGWFGCAVLADELVHKYQIRKNLLTIISIGICAVALSASYWYVVELLQPETGNIIEAVQKHVPADMLVIYRPTDLYVINNLHEIEVKTDHIARLANPKFLLLLHDNVITGLDFLHTDTLSLHPGGTPVETGTLIPGMQYWIYTLRPLHPQDSLTGHAVLCIMTGNEPELYSRNNWLTTHFVVLNKWLTTDLSRNGLAVRYAFAADGSKLQSGMLWYLQQNRNNRIRFYIIGK